jgi:Contractile injection system tape measure protein
MIKHVLNKQIFDLTIHQQLDAFHIQEQISRHFRNEVAPMLEQILNDRSKDDVVVSIDKIEINLGVIKASSIDGERWTDGLCEQIERLLDNISVVNGSITAKQEISLRRSALDQWLFYMHHGYLPWNLLIPAAMLNAQVLEMLATDADAVQTLRKLIAYDGAPLQRLVAQHDNQFLQAIVEVLTARSQTTLRLLLQNVIDHSSGHLSKKTPQRLQSAEALRQHLWKQFLSVAVVAANAGSQEIIERSFPQISWEDQNDLVSKSAEILRLIMNDSSATGGAETELRKPSHEERNATAFEPVDDSLFVSNAGLVILHPFLKTAFKRLGWTVDGFFIDEIAREKALYLLHYLATGRLTADEHELMIPKIICAWPMEVAVSNMLELNAEEIAEADGLLDAVIANWEKLQNASRDALREGFLQRNGKLVKNSAENLIHVEKNAIDILLDYLPWSLSLIMLPWRRELLRVEWR